MLSKLIIFVFGITTYGVFGQEYENYTTKDGLPSNHIFHSVQDSKGFMWFATNRGIAKFDGVKFKTFTTKDGLPNNDIWRLTADDEGRVWFNTKSKYLGYIENDSVYKFKVPDEETGRLIFWKANEGELILSNGALKNYRFKQNSFCLLDQYKIKKNQGYDMFDLYTKRTVLFKKDDVILYDSNQNEFLKIETKTLGSQNKDRGYEVLRGILPNFSAFYANRYDILFINFNEKKAERYSFKNLISKEDIKSMPLIISVDNEIQISFPGYLFILNQEFEIIKKHSFLNSPNNINSYKDTEGNIWLNDKLLGIILLPNSNNETKNFLQKKRIQKINKFNNHIIVGEQNVGIYSLKSGQDSFSFQQEVVGNIYQIKNNKKKGILSIASTPTYISKKDTSLKLKKFTLNYMATLDSQQREYFPSSFKGLEISKKHVFALFSSRFIKSDLKTKKSISNLLKTMLLTLSQYKEKIYTGGNDGLFLYENDSLIRPRGDSAILEIPVSFARSDNKYMFVGTDGRGVYLYDGEKEIYLKNTDGLVVQKILRANDKLWIATQEGVKVVTLNLKELEESRITDSYYESDGLPQNNTNDIYLEDSLLWIATDIGLSRINTKSPIYKQKTPVVFDFKNDTVTYNYSNNKQITAGFHALNYTNQNYLKYEYRLLPSNKEWITTNSGSINFSGLSPDLYTLEVKVTDQHFNQSVGKQYIQILPAWWQTNWAKAVFFLVIGFFLYSIFKYIQSRIKIAERKKTKLAGLELQALRSQMNPHFVHNSLNAIKYFMQRNESELSEEYLVKFSKLIRLFFDFSRKENITLKEEIQLLTLYLQIEKLRFEEKLSFLFEIDERIDLEDVIIPSMLLQPLVENAVNHGIFHKKGAGTINIVISYIDDNSYEVEIKDDGIGINEAKKIDHYSHENYQSKSSEVIRDRLELLNQSEKWDITYSMIDVSDSSEQQGTRVSLIFKQSQ